ncbi:MAG: hypothetical protein ACREA2_01385 [Blastocatellia bacterium]
MSLSIMQVETNLMRLEAEVAEALRQVREIKLTREFTPEEWRAARLERVRAENERLRPYIERVFEEMGINTDEEPLTAEEIQKLIAAEGVKPEDNLFSRMLIEMREE